MPQMGVSVSEGTITKWLKQEGETIEADESLLEISTDKVDTEVPSPGSGVVQQILVQEGETVEVGTKLAVIAPEGAEAPAAAEETPPEPATQEAAAEAEAPSSSEGETPCPSPRRPSPRRLSPRLRQRRSRRRATAGGKTFVSPVVARIASEHGVDVGQVSGTGRGGRVTKKDILALRRVGRHAGARAAAAGRARCARRTAGPARAGAGAARARSRPAAAAAAGTRCYGAAGGRAGRVATSR